MSALAPWSIYRVREDGTTDWLVRQQGRVFVRYVWGGHRDRHTFDRVASAMVVADSHHGRIHADGNCPGPTECGLHS